MEVISADIGNITSIFESETQTLLIESRIQEYFDNDLVEQDVFEYQGEQYITNAGEFENAVVKYEKENFFKLLSYGICTTASQRLINLSLNIPAGQYEKHKEELKNRVMQHRELCIKVNGEVKKVTINDVLVVPEGYGVYKTVPPTQLVQGAYTLVVDIGGGTTDLALFDHRGKFLEGRSIGRGLLAMYGQVLESLRTYGIKSIVDAKNYFDGELKLLNVDDKHKHIPHKETFTSVWNDIRGIYPTVYQYNVILCGGGAKIFENDFIKVLPQTIVVPSVLRTAQAARLIGGVKFGG